MTQTELNGGNPAGDTALRLALDKDTVRAKDQDGRLRVSLANISKANVCPYKGSEIPGWAALGLEPDRVYQLLRDPDELKKAADSLNGVPLLRRHVPISAADHKPYDVVGSVGTNVEFDGEYLKNSLFVSAQDAIDGIESGEQKELSAGYHYKPDMTSGNFRGTRFDGIMRDLVFNHVALVSDGRAGPDVVIGDSTENLNMKPTRLAVSTLAIASAYLSPRLAMDATLPADLFKGITRKNFAEAKPKIVAAVEAASKDKFHKGFAFDAGGLVRLLDALEHSDAGADESATEEQHKAMAAAANGEGEIGIPKEVGAEFADKDKGKTFDAEPLKNFLRGKGMSEDDITSLSGMLPQTGMDEDKEYDEDGEKDKEQQAMDAAIKKAATEAAAEARKTERDIRIALDSVKPWVGDLPVTLAFDSAADVHRHALKMLSVPGVKDMHADALLPVLQAQAKPGGRSRTEPRIAQDAAAADKTATRFPDLGRIGAA